MSLGFDVVFSSWNASQDRVHSRTHKTKAGLWRYWLEEMICLSPLTLYKSFVEKKVTTILTQLSQEIKTLHSFVYLKGQSNWRVHSHSLYSCNLTDQTCIDTLHVTSTSVHINHSDGSIYKIHINIQNLYCMIYWQFCHFFKNLFCTPWFTGKSFRVFRIVDSELTKVMPLCWRRPERMGCFTRRCWTGEERNQCCVVVFLFN